jgi:hypothetical protein
MVPSVKRASTVSRLDRLACLLHAVDLQGRASFGPADAFSGAEEARHARRVLVAKVEQFIIVGAETQSGSDSEIGALPQVAHEPIARRAQMRVRIEDHRHHGLTSEVDAGGAGGHGAADLGDLGAAHDQRRVVEDAAVAHDDPCAFVCGDALSVRLTGSTPMSTLSASSAIPSRASPGDTQIPSPGTDPWMACNAFDYKASSGVFAGRPSGYFNGDPVAETEQIADLLKLTVAGTLLGKKWEVTKAAAKSFFNLQALPRSGDFAPAFVPTNTHRAPEKAAQLQRCFNSKSGILGYTSRPLNGIWATPPYLHNGSVPTLYDLLLPPDERPRSHRIAFGEPAFYLGTREFDRNKVGYVTQKSDALGNTFAFQTHYEDGQEIDGNSNAGHDYDNAKLLPIERQAIVEYLKTL